MVAQTRFSTDPNKCFNFCIWFKAILCRVSHRKLLYSSFFNKLEQFLKFGLRGLTQGLHMPKSKDTHLYLHTMPSNPCQDYFTMLVLGCARSILGKSELNHTYQNCSDLSHSLIGAMINSQLLPQSSSKSIYIHHQPDCVPVQTWNPHREGWVRLTDGAWGFAQTTSSYCLQHHYRLYSR